MNLSKMKRVIGGKLYDTQTAQEVASDVYWDGHNFERHGRNQWLMKTKNGSYFSVNATLWQGERDSINPLNLEEAKELYEQLPEHEMEYAEAFGVEPLEA